MPGVIISGIKKCDLFAYDKFLRVHQEDEYTTFTGGLVSIILMIIFVAIFASTVSATFNRDIVHQVTENYRPDSPTMLGQNGNQPFLCALGIQHISLIKLPLFFQVWLIVKVSRRGKVIEQTKHSMQPCQRQDWMHISEEAGQIYDELQMKEWLCLPSNLSLKLNGTNSAKELSYAQLVVTRCDSQHYNCVNDSDYDQFIKANKYFTLKVYLTNPSISPGQEDYLKYYLDDTNHFKFTHTNGVIADLYFAEYTIETEKSIMPEPYSDIKVQKGAFMDSDMEQVQNFQVDSSVLAQVSFHKSINSVVYKRSFRRLDDTISYIGGLFGGLIMLMIILKKFNQYSFLLWFGNLIFRYREGQQIYPRRFHIHKFILYLFYLSINLFTTRWNHHFRQMNKYHEVRMQAEAQLSIDYLLKRIFFLERVMELRYNPQLLRQVQLEDRFFLQHIKNRREDYNNHQDFRIIVRAMLNINRGDIQMRHEYNQQNNELLRQDQLQPQINGFALNGQ